MSEEIVASDGILLRLSAENTAHIVGCNPGMKRHISFGGLLSEAGALHVTSIGGLADSDVISVKLSEWVQRIEDECFDGCRFLCEIEYVGRPALKYIGRRSFRFCPLKEILIPCKVNGIGAEAFLGCEFLREVIFEDGSELREIGPSAFRLSGLQRICIPGRVEVIGDSCFCHCESLREVKFAPKSLLRHIGPKSFFRTGISSIALPGRIRVGDLAFAFCCDLTDLLIGGKIQFEGDPFRCTSLKSLRKPAETVLDFDFGDCEVSHASRKDVDGLSRRLIRVSNRKPLSISDWILVGFDWADWEVKRRAKTSEGVLLLERDSHSRDPRWNGIEKIAIKALSPGGFTEILPPTETRSFVREMTCMIACHKHPCVVELIGCCLPSEKKGLRICVRSAGTQSLRSVLMGECRKDETISEWWTPTMKMKTVVSIVLAMKHVHKCGVVHRDLKPEGVFFDSERRIRVGSFGSSRKVSSGADGSGGERAELSSVGYPVYMAPELYDGRYNSSVDVYSFGLMLYEILISSRLFNGRAKLKLLAELQKGISPGFPDGVDPSTSNLINRCWHKDPRKRPTFEEIYEVLKKSEWWLIDGVDRGDVTKYVQTIEQEAKGSI
jgi:hypothetical protein